jgi:hypothetical protein
VTEPVYDDEAINALMRAYIACQLAVESLPRLPDEIRAVVDGPIRQLCDAVGPELDRVQPSARNDASQSFDA